MKALVLDKLLQQLKERGREKGTSSDLLEFYEELLRIEFEAEERLGVAKVALKSEFARKRLEEGLPLLELDKLELDLSYFKEVFSKVAATFLKYRHLLNPFPETFNVEELTPLELKGMLEAWFEGKREYPLSDILQAALKPFLSSYRRALACFVSQESWRRGYCPICGGAPDFAFLEEESGARWLVCSSCDFEWLFQRLECPGCGNTDQNLLGYFTDEEGRYRLYICEECKGYLKALDLRHFEAEFSPILERFFTLDMDLQAREKGYQPCSYLAKSLG